MRRYIISSNDYLSRDIDAYYRCDYLGFEQPNNPDYLNILKNTFNNKSIFTLTDAKEKVKLNLYDELSSILSSLPVTEAVICIVPRSKKLTSYSNNQLGFKHAIKETIALLNLPNMRIIDGSEFIIRHTDTRTTHLDKSGNGGEGDLPYIGITNNTCHISEAVRDKHILLIDDIYTKNVNLVEDAIQSLFDHGAHNVTFFSIGRTPHYSLKDINDKVIFRF